MEKSWWLALIVGLVLCASQLQKSDGPDACSTAFDSSSCRQEHEASEQQALLQTGGARLAKVKRNQAWPADELEAAGPELGSTYLPDSEAVAAVESAALLQQLQALLSKDGEQATVSFATAGQSYTYEMHAVSCYNANANISLWTGGAWQFIHPGKPRTFRSRKEGRYARARIHEDGTVSGLFEQEGEQIVDVRPLRTDATDDPAYSLLAQYQGDGHAHVFEYITPHDIGQRPYATLLGGPHPDVDPVDVEEAHTPVGDPISPSGGFEANSTWGGKKWFPGCYPSDSEPHTLVVAYVVPPNVFSGGSKSWWPTMEKAKAYWEEMLVKGSMIYEKQMNVQLVLGQVKAATEGGPEWAVVGCDKGDVSSMFDTLNGELKDAVGLPGPEAAAWYGWTNCGDDTGLMGRGYIRVLCGGSYGYSGGWNMAVGKWQAPTSWKTFAHELGHNFGATLSFAKGEGTTGGIMDYGDGKLNGHYQFNTKYHKAEVCGHLKSITGCEHFKAGVYQHVPAPTTPPPGSGGKGK